MPEPRIAFVTGVTGQDGANIAKCLLDDGWTVYGGFRRGSSDKTWRLDQLGITDRIQLLEFQLNDMQNQLSVLQQIKPTHIYHLAGESFVADSFKYPTFTMEVNTLGIINMLDAVRMTSPTSRLFFASSSEIFGHSNEQQLLGEDSPRRPSNPYGISKLAAQNFVSLYRERYGLFACSGILFNHESPVRGRQYVTRKITFNLARLRHEGGKAFDLGDLDAARDWGAAEDYVQGFRTMLALDAPEDFVFATGTLTTVREFLTIAASAAGFEPVFENQGVAEVCIDKVSGMRLAQVSEKYFRPQDTPPQKGDSSRLLNNTNWHGSRSLENLITQMVDADLERWKKGITNV